jgi:hypothetical protein
VPRCTHGARSRTRLHRAADWHDQHRIGRLDRSDRRPNLAEEAARQSVTPDELAARVLAEHIPTRRRLGFVAIGESTSGRTAAEAEEMLAEGFGR